MDYREAKARDSLDCGKKMAVARWDLERSGGVLNENGINLNTSEAKEHKPPTFSAGTGTEGPRGPRRVCG